VEKHPCPAGTRLVPRPKALTPEESLNVTQFDDGGGEEEEAAPPGAARKPGISASARARSSASDTSAIAILAPDLTGSPLDSRPRHRK
jgi:hypothetical protein